MANQKTPNTEMAQKRGSIFKKDFTLKYGTTDCITHTILIYIQFLMTKKAFAYPDAPRHNSVISIKI